MNDYKDLIERLIALSNHEHDDLSIGCEAADAIQNLDIAYHLEKADHERTKEELDALKQKISSAEPVAVLNKIHQSLVIFHPFVYESEAHERGELRMLYTLEGIKE